MTIACRLFARLFVSTVLLLGASVAFASPAELIRQARENLNAGKAQAAYDLLADREADYAGNANFDYWFGLAAVRAGKPARASFALERVIADNPNHAGARLELAAAYLQLGQRDAASAELDVLDKLNPPPEAAQRIAALNKELNRQERREGESRRGGYVGLELGHDDNVGTWPQGLELFPGATLDAIDSAYATVRAGGWYRLKPAADQKVTLSLNGQMRSNQEDDAEQFDQEYLSGRVEWSRDLDGRHEIAATVDLGALRRDGEDYYSLWGVGGEWRRKISASRKFVAGLQLRQIMFDADMFDHTVTRASARFSDQVAPRWSVAVDINVDYEAAENDRPGGDAALFGIHGSSWYQVAPRHRLGAQLGVGFASYRSDYLPGEAINNSVNESREDLRLNTSLLWDWFPVSRLQVRGQAMYRDQDSTVEAFTYDQTVFSAGLSYYF
jgi:tetratricopeptide (TPR) repeat protein